MQMTIAKFGRIVIPKVLRDGLHLTSGTVLEVEEKAGSLILRPFHEQPVLVRKNGFLAGCVASSFWAWVGPRIQSGGRYGYFD